MNMINNYLNNKERTAAQKKYKNICFKQSICTYIYIYIYAYTYKHICV